MPLVFDFEIFAGVCFLGLHDLVEGVKSGAEDLELSLAVSLASCFDDVGGFSYFVH